MWCARSQVLEQEEEEEEFIDAKSTPEMGLTHRCACSQVLEQEEEREEERS